MGATAERKRERPQSGVRAKTLGIGEHAGVPHASQSGTGRRTASGSKAGQPLPHVMPSRRLRLAIVRAGSSQRAVQEQLGIASTSTVPKWCNEAHAQCITGAYRELLRIRCPEVWNELRRLESEGCDEVEPALLVDMRRHLDDLEREHARLVAVLRARLEAEG